MNTSVSLSQKECFANPDYLESIAAHCPAQERCWLTRAMDDCCPTIPPDLRNSYCLAHMKAEIPDADSIPTIHLYRSPDRARMIPPLWKKDSVRTSSSAYIP